MKTKIFLIAFLCMLLSLFSVFSWYYIYYNSIDTTVFQFEENIEFSDIETQQYSQVTRDYAYKVYIPSNVSEDAFKVLMEFCNGEITSFVSEVESLSPKSVLKRLFPSKEPNILLMNYTENTHLDDYISVTFQIDKILREREESRYIKTFTFKTDKGEVLPLTHFFPENADYIKALWEACKTKLSEISANTLIDSIENPHDDTFSRYNVLNDGFLIYLDNVSSPLYIKFDELSCETIFTRKPPPPPKVTPKKGKRIALTFDDGPNPSTTKTLLDGLKKWGVKATFFVQGYRVEKNKKLIKRMYDEGHLIGNHSYNHENYLKLSTADLDFQIKHTNALIEEITGETVVYLRPTYGNYTDEVAENYNMCLVLWSIDPEDWKYKDANRIARHIVNKAKDGDIILLHDIYKTSVEGALKAIDILKEKGFEFVRVDELLVTEAGPASPNTVYHRGK